MKTRTYILLTLAALGGVAFEFLEDQLKPVMTLITEGSEQSLNAAQALLELHVRSSYMRATPVSGVAVSFDTLEDMAFHDTGKGITELLVAQLKKHPLTFADDPYTLYEVEDLLIREGRKTLSLGPASRVIVIR